MRLPERYKQDIYVSNETYFNSQNYKKPYLIRGIVVPKSDSLEIGGGVSLQQNNVLIKLESNQKGVDLITQNSKIWIKRKPDINEKKGDYTHTVVSRDASTHNWFITIECQSAGGNFPML